MSSENKGDFTITWVTTPLADLPQGYGWSENGVVNDEIRFMLYYNDGDGKVYLHDILDDVKYLLPDGAKYRGYLIAFKLNNLRKPSKPKTKISDHSGED